MSGTDEEIADPTVGFDHERIPFPVSGSDEKGST
jgi:hypothetical protein